MCAAGIAIPNYHFTYTKQKFNIKVYYLSFIGMMKCIISSLFETSIDFEIEN